MKTFLLLLALVGCEHGELHAPIIDAGEEVWPVPAQLCEACYQRGRLECETKVIEERTSKLQDQTMMLQMQKAMLEIDLEYLTRDAGKAKR